MSSAWPRPGERHPRYAFTGFSSQRPRTTYLPACARSRWTPKCAVAIVFERTQVSFAVLRDAAHVVHNVSIRGWSPVGDCRYARTHVRSGGSARYPACRVRQRAGPRPGAGRDAAELWAAFDRVERLAAAGKTLLARRLADTHQPDETGTKTAAEALARRGGTSLGAARDALETSTRLRDLPQVEAAVRRGELSRATAAKNPTTRMPLTRSLSWPTAPVVCQSRLRKELSPVTLRVRDPSPTRPLSTACLPHRRSPEVSSEL